MITDFPEIKKEIKRVVDAVLRQKVKENAPAMSLANKVTLHEGNKLGVIHPDGKHVVNELQYVESGFTIPKKEIPVLKPDDFMAKVSAAAEDMAGQMERGLFQKIDESVKEGGNTIPGNPELSPDSILTALEMITIDFEDDDRAKPVKPSIFADPVAINKLLEKIAQLTPEQKAINESREKTIIDKKYEEHLKDLDSRKIVD
jgi:hypothetical protein